MRKIEVKSEKDLIVDYIKKRRDNWAMMAMNILSCKWTITPENKELAHFYQNCEAAADMLADCIAEGLYENRA